MDPSHAKFVCGAECGIAVVGTLSAGTEHWSTVGGAPSVVTSGPATMRSTRCFSLGTSAQLIHTFASAIGSPATVVARYYIYFATLPTATAICGILPLASTNAGLVFNASDNTLRTNSGGTQGSSGIVVTTGIWYRIDYKSVHGANLVVDGAVDGVALAQASTVQSASSCTGAEFVNGTSTGSVYIDDIIVSGTSGDYPIGAGVVAGLYPNGDKTNSLGAGSDDGIGHFFSATTDFAKGTSGATATGAQNAESTSWQSLQNPLSATIGSTWIADLLGASTEHLVWTLSDLPSDALSINGVLLVATLHAAAATANNQSMKYGTSDGTQRATAWSLLDLSETTITVPVAILPTSAGGSTWTVSSVVHGLNTTLIVWGDSSDVNPDPYLDGVCLEVDYVPYAPRVVSVNQAVQRAAVR